MNKYEFMYVLSKELSDRSIHEQSEIMSDYEEHFRIGAEEGKTDEEIAEELGDPRKLALSYCDSLEETAGGETAEKIPQSEQAQQNKEGKINWPAVILVVLVAIFVLLPVLGTLLSILFGIAGTSLALVGSGIFTVALCVAASNAAMAIGTVLLGLGLILLGVAGGFLTYFVGYCLWKLCVLCWNFCARFIKEA